MFGWRKDSSVIEVICQLGLHRFIFSGCHLIFSSLYSYDLPFFLEYAGDLRIFVVVVAFVSFIPSAMYEQSTDCM
jgi:hypothetical protein